MQPAPTPESNKKLMDRYEELIVRLARSQRELRKITEQAVCLIQQGKHRGDHASDVWRRAEQLAHEELGASGELNQIELGIRKLLHNAAQS